MYRTRDLLAAIDASGHVKIQQEFWRARLLDPDQTFSEHFELPPQILYKYIPERRLDDALPDGGPCSFRATPPNELNDINEISFLATFVDDEGNREDINRDYASTLTELFPASPVSPDDVERYRRQQPVAYGAQLACDQLSKRYGVTSFSARNKDVKMWSHYADDCRGVVIGYNVDQWVNHLVGTSVIRQVTYADRPPLVLGPRVLNQENAYGFMSWKGASWEDEREWRLITELSKTQQAREGISVISVPQQSVSSVVITNRTPEDVVDRIVGRLRDPSNGYRVSRIDKMQRGHDVATLALIGQIDVRAPRGREA